MVKGFALIWVEHLREVFDWWAVGDKFLSWISHQSKISRSALLDILFKSRRTSLPFSLRPPPKICPKILDAFLIRARFRVWSSYYLHHSGKPGSLWTSGPSAAEWLLGSGWTLSCKFTSTRRNKSRWNRITLIEIIVIILWIILTTYID